jgi:hypothetical protein
VPKVRIYKYPTTNKRPAPPSRKPTFAKEAEQLTGTVNGIAAVQGEERFARALRKDSKARRFYFRVNPTTVPRGFPGWLELDFLVETNFGWRAFEIDGMDFVHRGIRKAAEMVVKDLKRREGLAKMGISVRDIEHVDEASLQTQEAADKTVKNLLQ